MREVNFHLSRGAQQHARLRLPAIAFGFALSRMKTDFDAVEWKLPPHFGVNGLDQFFFDRAATYVRLICGNDEQKTGGLQFGARFGNAGENFKFCEGSWRIRLAVMRQRAIDDAIAIQKNGAFEFGIYFVLSHLVCPTLSFGCETSRCQMTA